MLIITETETLAEQAKKGKLDSLTAKDSIYCFNKDGSLIDVSFISIATKIKASLTILPSSINLIGIAYLIGLEHAENVCLLLNDDFSALIAGIELINADKIHINYTDKIGSTIPKERKVRKKKEETELHSGSEPETAPVTNNEEEITPNTDAASIDKKIKELCLNSENETLQKIGANNDYVIKLRKAILESSDKKIGYPLYLGMNFGPVYGKESVSKMTEAAQAIYSIIKPNSR